MLVVAAERREFSALAERGSGFVPGPPEFRWSRFGELAGRRVLLVANGPGRKNAARAVELAAAKFDLTGIVSTGFAGALDPDFRVGDAFLAGRVIQHEGGLKYAVELPAHPVEMPANAGTLLTVDRVAQDARTKAKLRESGAAAVDMEASAVAAQAAGRGLPFYCVRAISDEAATDFGVDFNAARRSDGAFSGWQIVRQAGLSPDRWRELLSLWRDSQIAAATLARILNECRFPR